MNNKVRVLFSGCLLLINECSSIESRTRYNDSDYGSTPDWNEAIKKLADEYPKHFSKEEITERLERYKGRE